MLEIDPRLFEVIAFEINIPDLGCVSVDEVALGFDGSTGVAATDVFSEEVVGTELSSTGVVRLDASLGVLGIGMSVGVMVIDWCSISANRDNA